MKNPIKLTKLSIPKKRSALKSILKSGYDKLTSNVVSSVRSANKATKIPKIKYVKPKKISFKSSIKSSKLKFKF